MSRFDPPYATMHRDKVNDFYKPQEKQSREIRSLKIAMFVPDFIAIGALFLVLHFGLGILFSRRNLFSLAYIAGLIVLAALYAYLLARFQYSVAKKDGATFILKRFSLRPLDLKKSPDRLCLGIADDVQKAAGLAKIDLQIIPGQALNALAAVGPAGIACLALSEGLLEEFSPEEIKAVIAREMAIVAGENGLFRTILCSLGDFIERILDTSELRGGDKGSRTFSLPSAIRRHLSRYLRPQRDFQADAAAAGFGADPVALARAIAKACARIAPDERSSLIYSPLLFVPPLSPGENESLAGWRAAVFAPPLTRIRRLSILADQKTEDIIPSKILEGLEKQRG